jgi:hypothetical protein
VPLALQVEVKKLSHANIKLQHSDLIERRAGPLLNTGRKAQIAAEAATCTFTQRIAPGPAESITRSIKFFVELFSMNKTVSQTPPAGALGL